MTNWLPVVIIGVVYAVIYYFVFTFFIVKFDLKTPGREEEGVASKLHTKDEYREAKGIGTNSEFKNAPEIVDALGGQDNLIEVDNCATRLRLKVKDSSLVDEAALRQTGAAGIMKSGESVQVIYGTKVPSIKTNIDEYLESRK